MNKCLWCGFETKNPKYCSLSCGAKAQPRDRKILTKVCLECSSSFNPNRNDSRQKYCSRSCAATANNKKYPKLPAGTYRKCRRAGCEKVVPSHSKVYCSNEHYREQKISDRISGWFSGSLLIEDSGASMGEGSIIREYLYAQQNQTCALCPQKRTWNGKPLNFILDHIDGNSGDSRRENVRLVCPNCDFQLPTSKGKNVGKGRYTRRLRYINGQSR